MSSRMHVVGLALSVTFLANSAESVAWQDTGRRRVDCSRPKNSETATEPRAAESAVDGPGGTFVPGPANGAVRSGSTTLGINSGAIRIPAMTLALPSIQLPSLSRIRRGASCARWRKRCCRRSVTALRPNVWQSCRSGSPKGWRRG